MTASDHATKPSENTLRERGQWYGPRPRGGVESRTSTAMKEDIMQVARIGLDLAKYVFEVHGVDNHGKVIVRKRLRRDAVASFFANLPACLVGMEASNGAHYWARVLTELGHQVRLISPQFVTPYVKSNKNDRNDAEAICEAVGRPSMRFVPVKSAEQLAVQAVHRIRSRLVADRVRLVNQVRGLLGEHGIVVAKTSAIFGELWRGSRATMRTALSIPLFGRSCESCGQSWPNWMRGLRVTTERSTSSTATVRSASVSARSKGSAR